MRKILIVAALVATAALAACHDSPPPQAQAQLAPQVIEQPAPQPQTVYVQAPQQPQTVVVQNHDNSAANLAAGMMIGAAMSGGNRTVVEHHYHPAPVYVAPRPVYVAPRPVYIAPRPVYSAPIRSSVSTSSGYRRR